MAGFVYIMSNPAFPNLIKIGKSKRDPTTDRVKELNQTGVPEPFKVEYYAFVEDEDYLERALHTRFNAQRPNQNREFFGVDCLEAIEAIRTLSLIRAKIKYEEVFYVSAERLAQMRQEQEQFNAIQAERLEEQKAEKQTQQEKENAAIKQRKDLDNAAELSEKEDTAKFWIIIIILFWLILVLNKCTNIG